MVILKFIKNYLLAIDQLLNTVLLGHPDETLSSRLGRTINGNHRYFWVPPLRWLVDALFWFDSDIVDGKRVGHCQLSVMPLEQQNFRSVVDYEIWSWSKDI